MFNVLLIGGSGFIGSHIVKELFSKKYNVTILVLPGSYTSHLTSISEKIKMYYGSLNDYDLIREILKSNQIDTVIHLVSTLLPSSSIDCYIREFDTVIKPTIRLLPLLSNSNIRIVYFSSGGTIYGVQKEAKLAEITQSAPISYYGQSKLIIEESIKLENRKSGLSYLIIRPSNPYGSGQRLNGNQGLIATSIGHILNNEKIQVWGDGNIVRDYIYIDDFIKAIITILEIGDNNETYNIGSGKGYSINEVIDFLRRSVPEKIEVEYLEGRPVDVPSLILDVTKLHEICEPIKTPLEKGINDFFLDEREKKQKKI